MHAIANSGRTTALEATCAIRRNHDTGQLDITLENSGIRAERNVTTSPERRGQRPFRDSGMPGVAVIYRSCYGHDICRVA
jgi:hypothetical protein